MKKYKSLFEKDSLEEMANLIPKDTGLDFTIWIFPRTGKEKHKLPRIKIEIEKGNRIPISIGDNPMVLIDIPIKSKFLKQIKEFIIKNKSILLDYWESGETMSLRDIFKQLKKV